MLRQASRAVRAYRKRGIIVFAPQPASHPIPHPMRCTLTLSEGPPRNAPRYSNSVRLPPSCDTAMWMVPEGESALPVAPPPGASHRASCVAGPRIHAQVWRTSVQGRALPLLGSGGSGCAKEDGPGVLAATPRRLTGAPPGPPSQRAMARRAACASRCATSCMPPPPPPPAAARPSPASGSATEGRRACRVRRYTMSLRPDATSSVRRRRPHTAVTGSGSDTRATDSSAQSALEGAAPTALARGGSGHA